MLWSSSFVLPLVEHFGMVSACFNRVLAQQRDDIVFPGIYEPVIRAESDHISGLAVFDRAYVAVFHMFPLKHGNYTIHDRIIRF